MQDFGDIERLCSLKEKTKQKKNSVVIQLRVSELNCLGENGSEGRNASSFSFRNTRTVLIQSMGSFVYVFESMISQLVMGTTR